jgi:hypothetical protein
MNRPRFIVLSGSTRFLDTFKREYIRIACEGNIPFTIAGKEPKGTPEYDRVKPLLDKMYINVIRLYADELLVLNVEGYIGESTTREIAYARMKGIPVHFLEPIRGKLI